ncbi:phosphoglycerate mutase [Tersicoccus solisilvae]|uniref:Phosphoglycerate mutase n=1 Tax=Tersicoccus solisilvae TaxID=1882339 RepID=A0ABQ1PAV5_9MICC|nr:histidine phosphatase family protein [Tersicoccus solisilvae]GGC93293.1 phosphoglycerate mutase [Tersicoccus solisilvae]
MTTFSLVRHGRTSWQDESRYAGVSDIALTATGRAQADALAAWAVERPGGEAFTAVRSSTLRRAVDTASPAAEALGLTLATDARLGEVDFGAGEGLTRVEMDERFPEASAAHFAHPGVIPLPGGEPGATAIARGSDALRELESAHPDGHVLVVSHGTLIRLLLCALLWIDIDRYRTVFPEIRNGSVTTVRISGHRAELLDLNVVPPAG